MKKDDSQIILICLYVIIVLLLVNTIFTIINTGSKTAEKEQEVGPVYDVSMMELLNLNEVVALFDGKGTYVVYIGRSECPHCVNFLPTLQRAQNEFNYVTIKVDADLDENRDPEATAKLRDLLTMEYTMQFEEGPETKTFGEFYYQYGFVPTTFIIKDGKMVDGIIGGLDFKAFAELLEKNGFKK